MVPSPTVDQPSAPDNSLAALASLPSDRAAYCLGYTIVVALALRLLVSICLHPLRIGWDPSLHLMCATLICQGKLPYVDMFDVNPPLIWYINTLPASLAALCNSPLPIAFNLFLLALITLAAALAVYVIVAKLPRRDLFVNLGVVFGLLLFNFFLSVDFGQREEIFVLLFIPFAFFRLARWQGVPLRPGLAVLYGIVGAVGIFMKHYFVLNFLVVELFLLFSFRNFRHRQSLQLSNLRRTLAPLWAPEIVTMVVVGLVYTGHFFLLPAAVRHNYFDFLIPAFAKGYYFWDTSVTNCIATPYKRDVFLLLTAAGVIGLTLTRFYPIIGALISFSLAGLVVYLMQFKGWAYQDIPAMAGAFMLVGAIVGAVFSAVVNRSPVSSRAKKISRTGRSAIANLAAYILSAVIAFTCIYLGSDEITATAKFPTFDMAALGYKGTTPSMDIDGPFTDYILKNSKPNDPIVFISNAVAPAFPITMQLRRTVGSRHLHVCILSVLQYIRSDVVRSPEVDRLLAFDGVVVKQLGDDILKNNPPLVFLQNDPIKNDYFLRYDFSKRYLYRYQLVEPIINFSVYKLADLNAPAPVLPPMPDNNTATSTGASGVH